MEPGKIPPATDVDLSPAVAVPPPRFEDPVLDELSRKMQTWSEAWFGSETANESRVRRRLHFWLKRCLGGQAGAVLTDRTDDLSLAKSAPLLTAFLGRRAMVEVSRRVLNDS